MLLLYSSFSIVMFILCLTRVLRLCSFFLGEAVFNEIVWYYGRELETQT